MGVDVTLDPVVVVSLDDLEELRFAGGGPVLGEIGVDRPVLALDRFAVNGSEVPEVVGGDDVEVGRVSAADVPVPRAFLLQELDHGVVGRQIDAGDFAVSHLDMRIGSEEVFLGPHYPSASSSV